MACLLPMSKKEVNRYDVMKRLLRKEMNGSEAAQLLKLTSRQVRRLKSRIKALGATGLIHKARGRKGNRALPENERARIASLLHKRYADFKPTFASEKLGELHNIHHDPKTIRSIMIAEGLWKPKQKRANDAHRQWRERKARFGEMEQFDGSYEHWFEDRGPECCLLAAIDDATGTITRAQFDCHEGVLPVFGFWKGYVADHGKPRSIYLDKLSTYKQSSDIAKQNHDALSQFERAMTDVGIEPIPAGSPQAKGRIERLFGTLQDRLVKELRLANISSIEAANEFLAAVFIPKFNQRFGVAPRSTGNLHASLSPKERARLDRTFSRHTSRIVRSDFTVSYHNQWYQLAEHQPVTVCKKDSVIIEEHTDGEIKIRRRDACLSYAIIPKGAPKQKAPLWVLAASAPKSVSRRTPVKPAPDHPWRRFTFANQSSLSHRAKLPD